MERPVCRCTVYVQTPTLLCLCVCFRWDATVLQLRDVLPCCYVQGEPILPPGPGAPLETRTFLSVVLRFWLVACVPRLTHHGVSFCPPGGQKARGICSLASMEKLQDVAAPRVLAMWTWAPHSGSEGPAAHHLGGCTLDHVTRPLPGVGHLAPHAQGCDHD